MKTITRFFALVVLFAASALAQTGSGGSNYVAGVRYVLVAPSGSCPSTSIMQLVMGPGDLWSCVSGTWTKIATGGGGSSSFPVTGTSVNASDAGGGTMSVDLHASPGGTGDGNVLAAYYKGGTGSFSLPGFALGGGSGFKTNTHSTGNKDWTWTDNANDYFGLKADASTSQPGFVISSLGCLDFASSGNLSANAGMNVDTTGCRTSALTINWGDATNTGQVTHHNLINMMANGDANTPQEGFAAQATNGWYYDPVHGQALWTDPIGIGGPLWGFNTSQNFVGFGGIYVVDPNGFVGFGPGDGSCSACFIPIAYGAGDYGLGLKQNTGFFNSQSTGIFGDEIGSPLVIAGGTNHGGMSWSNSSTLNGIDTKSAAICYDSSGILSVEAGGCTIGLERQGKVTLKSIAYSDGCVSSGGTCGANTSGFVTIAPAATTVTVSTTAVLSNSTCNSTTSQTCSHIHVFEDMSKGAALGVTCNTTVVRSYAVSAVTNQTSFVITSSAAPTVNPACIGFTID